MILPHDPPTGESAPLDLDLIRKYAIPGPRYTSYPPANKFHDRLLELDLEATIAADNTDPNRPLSLYFHLPFCASRCWYCGCTTIITRRQDWATTYLAELKKEIALIASRIDLNRPVEQLHFGGGTPTFFSADSLRELGEVLRSTFRFAPDAECSIEIDPRVVSPEQVQVLADLGINRASLGIQDTNTEVQEAGINDINLDLIYGLPRQTVATVEQTVKDVLELSPDRLSVFSYAHVPWIKPAQRIFDKRGQMPGPEDKLAMFGVIGRGLMKAGFVDVGLDHFARPDDPLAIARREGTLHRNFQGYSTKAGASLYAFGISSISSSPDAYWQNPKSLSAYREALQERRLPAEKGYRLTAEDKRRRRLIMGIMCDRGLDFERLGREWDCRITETYAAELDSLVDLRKEGLVEWDESGLQVTPRGEPLLRVVAMAFDQTLVKKRQAHALTV